MKRKINKILAVIGFVLVVVGLIMGLDATAAFSYFSIAAALSLAFVFASNATVRNVGYALGALVGIDGVIILMKGDMNTMLIGIGYVLYLVSAALYFIEITIGFFGFVKNSEAQKGGTASTLLLSYKQLETDKVITEEEFNELKARVFESSNTQCATFGDLKNWKKLLDKKVITEEEFASLKEKMFRK